MWQEIVVGALVSVSAAYAVWALMPAAARLRLARRILRWSEMQPTLWWLRNAARSAESRAQKRLAGCGGCGGAASVRREEPRR
jgi:hypothetical protein